jgi:UDPglucose--hexose-1-phosphate uridylyltransferase
MRLAPDSPLCKPAAGDMKDSQLQQFPHRRFNPLSREWVLVSPHRTQRPWLGKTDKNAPANSVAYDPTCYLCPGNERAGGVRNPPYTSTFSFDNDYPALLRDSPRFAVNDADLFVAESEVGICRVACFSPRHDLTIPIMSHHAVREVVDAWSEEYRELETIPWIRHIQIFENRGALMGASNPHPHGQIWATASLPTMVVKELSSFEEYRNKKQSCLLCDYLRLELARGERLVCQNDGFVVVVPYWALWPFETLLLSRRHVGALREFSLEERDLLADILRQTTIRYDNLFETPFPYSMGFHQAPLNGPAHTECHFHGHYYPPLLRSAAIRKFMVGYELLGTPQRDITPESAAERLASLSGIHYSCRATSSP